MGFLSKLAKKFKKFAKSKVGKVVLGAALIYVGGAALGAWKAAGPLAKINGVLRAGSAAGTAAAGSAAGTAAAGSAAMPAGIEAITVTGKAAGSSMLPSVAGGAALAAPTLKTAAPQLVPEGMSPVGPQPAASPEPQGFISKIMNSKAVKFVDQHPYASAMMLNAGASAMSPDQIDIMREQQDLQLATEEQDRQRRLANLNISGVNVGGGQVSSGPLRYASTGQPVFRSGFINSARGV